MKELDIPEEEFPRWKLDGDKFVKYEENK